MFDWIKKTFGLRSMPPPAAKRLFAAANTGRLTASWGTTPTTINQDLQRGLRQLRARSRDLARNNDYARNFVRLCVRNIVGPEGFGLQVQAARPDGKIDTVDSKTIADAFWLWAKRGQCDVTGQHSLLTLQRLIIETLVKDGECLIRRVKGKGDFGYQLQMLDVGLLDETLNTEAASGNRIVMGVELDEWDKPVAYHIKQANRLAGERLRVLADEIWHLFLPLEIGQQRGVPWMTTGMIRMNMLGGYEEAAVTAARVGAAKMGFFTQDETSSGGAALGEYEDAAQAVITDAEPGTFETLPVGMKFESFNPDYPHALYGEFTKACLRGMAAGMGVSYNGLTGDLENVNYSSIRAGLLDERDEWMALQSWLIDVFLAPMYSEWLPLAILSGQLALPMSKLAKFDAARWQGRRWQWVDPKKDMEASILAIENGLSTWSDVLTSLGIDPEEFKQRFQRDINEFGPLIKQMKAFSGGVQDAVGGGDTLKSMADTYGVLVRAGAVTPQTGDEEFMRSATGLPAASAEVKTAWQDVGGVRRPVTLAVETPPPPPEKTES
ncbi:phage portal protein [Deefgea piscis]|uniref:Phage portal protein n=1 Tax=Deefgea piscis TaxID=2739061 RepID=A0A6M8STS1_9NEIS|nr:phage portal protein [Deefgea piscis]QKJ67478.1 phage portal protein [Deefgea piscis]